MRRAAKQDASQWPIVEALRKIGARVYFMGKPVDLLVAWRGQWHVLEVKSEGGRLTQAQVQFIAENTAPVHVVQTVDEAFAAILGDKMR